MASIKGFIRFISDPAGVLRYLASKNMVNWMPDKVYLSVVFRHMAGYEMDWDKPITFNQKLQWIKVYDHNPIYTSMVDKYEVRKFVADTIGEKYLIPLLGVWNTFDEIDFCKLPNQFVLKCTHDSGGLVICKDKATFDRAEAKDKIETSLKRNYYAVGREWPYKNIKPRIIAEEYMQDSSSSALKDYKLLMFNGELGCSFVCSNRYSANGLNVTFFDPNWNRMPFERKYHADTQFIAKPSCYAEMITIAQKLSTGIPFVRVDLYEIGGRVYFGEMTFFPGNGTERFYPQEWDTKLGEMLTLPEKHESRI